MWDWFKGKKTYTAVIFGIAYLWIGVYLGKIDVNDAIKETGNYVIGATIRKGIADSTA
jgi:hypothetical protein